MYLTPVQITGTGHYVPEQIIDNYELSRKLGVSEEWIFSRTGINHRHICYENETTSGIALKASTQALEEAGVSPEDIDLIVFCTLSPDKLCPSAACKLQAELGAVNAFAFDLNAACSGFVYGLSVAYQYIATGFCKTVLVVGSDLLSRYTDYNDKTTSILFGDAAGAAIVKASDENSIFSFVLGSEGKIGDCIQIPSSGSEKSELPPYFIMRGQEVFKWAVSNVPGFISESVGKAGLTLSEIDHFIIHQANQRISKAIMSRLEIPEAKVHTNINEYGNTSAASIPLLLSQISKEGLIKKGQKLVLAGFGGGITWGTCVLEWTLDNYG